MSLIKICETPGILRTIMILDIVFNIITILVPIIIIITIIMNVSKVIVSGKEEDLKSIIPSSAKKIIAGIIIFLLPTILSTIFSLTGETFYELNTCILNANAETIDYYEELLPVEYKIQNAENNPTENNIEQAREAVLSVTGYAKEDTMMDYMQRLSEAETKSKDLEEIKKCESKGGSYDNGYCYIPKPLIVKDEEEENNYPSSSNPNQSTGGMSSSNLLNGDYYVVDTAVSVKSYLNLISSEQIAETKNVDVYSGNCLAFAYLHAYSLYSGNTSARADDALGYIYSGKFDGYVNDSKQAVLEKVYNEVSNGRPCLIQVNGNKEGTSRHYVTVVGFKKSVTSASNITEDDLLIIDSYDGKIENMDSNSSRFMVTGAACHKDYSGYQMYYIEY